MFIDIDPTHWRVYRHARQGAEAGRLKGQRTLHPILATLSTPITRPVIGAVHLRRGKDADVRGAQRFVAEALAIPKDAGGSGIRPVRADSKFYTADVVAACRRAGAHLSLTTGMNPFIAAAIAGIEEADWVAIRYPDAFVDPDTGEMVSDAEAAETTHTGRRKAEQVTARLIVRPSQAAERRSRLPHLLRPPTRPPTHQRPVRHGPRRHLPRTPPPRNSPRMTGSTSTAPSSAASTAAASPPTPCSRPPSRPCARSASTSAVSRRSPQQHSSCSRSSATSPSERSHTVVIHYWQRLIEYSR